MDNKKDDDLIFNYSESFGLTGATGTDTIGSAPNSSQDFWYEDGYSITGNPSSPAPDTITFNITEADTFSGTKTPWKFNEDKILKKLEEYLAGTYNQHYADKKTGDQTLDKIKPSRREGFCAGNVVKYIDRYDTKGTPRQDLFKVLHYTMLLINHLDLIENK